MKKIYVETDSELKTLLSNLKKKGYRWRYEQNMVPALPIPVVIKLAENTITWHEPKKREKSSYIDVAQFLYK